jgi:hypothetical protein
MLVESQQTFAYRTKATKEERMKTTVSCFALNKYWKGSLTSFIVMNFLAVPFRVKDSSRGKFVYFLCTRTFIDATRLEEKISINLKTTDKSGSFQEEMKMFDSICSSSIYNSFACFFRIELLDGCQPFFDLTMKRIFWWNQFASIFIPWFC